MSNFYIAYADINDINKLALIEKECINDPWSINAFESEFQKENAIIIKAVTGDIICGFITADIILDEVNIYNVAVSKDYRRMGIAKKMLLFLEENTKDKAAAYFLEVRESNFNAIALYSNLEYQKIGTRKNFYTNPCENAILMSKRSEML